MIWRLEASLCSIIGGDHKSIPLSGIYVVMWHRDALYSSTRQTNSRGWRRRRSALGSWQFGLRRGGAAIGGGVALGGLSVEV